MAKNFGEKIVENQYDLIYGGASVGLMGTLADSVLAQGGYVTGIIPRFIQEREFQHKSIQNLIVTDTMHERKTKIYDKSDAIAILPGGFGTLDEAFEFMTWIQLGLHHKKIAFLNWEQFYTPIKAFCDNAREKNFIKHYDHFEPKFFDSTDQFFQWLQEI